MWRSGVFKKKGVCNSYQLWALIGRELLKWKKHQNFVGRKQVVVVSISCVAMKCFEVRTNDFYDMFIHTINVFGFIQSSLVNRQKVAHVCGLFSLLQCLFFVHFLCDVMSCDTTAFVGAHNRQNNVAALVTWRILVDNPITNWYATACACLRSVFPSATSFFCPFLMWDVSCDATAFVGAQKKGGKRRSFGYLVPSRW